MRVGFGSFMANAWARSFLAHCASEMKGVVLDHRSAASQIRGNARALFWEREPLLPDKQTKALIASCCLVLAAYRHLRGRLPEAQAFEMVRGAAFRTYQKPMRFLARLWLSLTRDPLERLRGNWWMNQSRRMYGSGMQFDQEETGNSVDLIVRRCAFHEFFADQGEPGLTRVFCAWDRNWMDVVDASSHSIRTERPTTISTGSDCCRFRLTRDDPSRREESKDVILLGLSRLPGRPDHGQTKR